MACDQRLHRLRRAAEAVGELLAATRSRSSSGLAAGEALVQARAARARRCNRFLAARAGTWRLISVVTPSGSRQIGLAPGFQCRHRALQHVGVELKAHLLHFARLLVAEHLAGAADLEVVHREVEAGAQVFHHLYRLEAFLRLRRQRVLGRRQQVRVCLMVRASDAARGAGAAAPSPNRSARSMMIVLAVGTSMPVSMIVEQTSRLIALRVEVAHHVLELALAHLAMRDGDARLGQQLTRGAPPSCVIVSMSLCRK